ncbi:MAG: GEVED domain-containing protein, partial [Thermoguttaceae bacterium]
NYAFFYDETNNVIRLEPKAKVWADDSIYVITLANEPVTGILDKVGNPLEPTRISGATPLGETKFTVILGGELDFGDAPDDQSAPQYPTLLGNNGAAHLIVPDLYLGAAIDTESDGQPTPAADGDGDDDDGVSFDTPLNMGIDATITVTAVIGPTASGGFLDAWIDYNGDGDWNDPGEQIFTSEPLVDGDNTLTWTMPDNIFIGDSYARFRISEAGGQFPAGLASAGEVEDYQVVLTGNPWNNPRNPYDVDDSGDVNSIDVVILIWILNHNGGFVDLPPSLTPDAYDPPNKNLTEKYALDELFPDVNDDGTISSIDVVSVIYYLNNDGDMSALAAGGEGEPDVAVAKGGFLLSQDPAQDHLFATSTASLLVPQTASRSLDVHLPEETAPNDFLSREWAIAAGELSLWRAQGVTGGGLGDSALDSARFDSLEQTLLNPLGENLSASDGVIDLRQRYDRQPTAASVAPQDDVAFDLDLVLSDIAQDVGDVWGDSAMDALLDDLVADILSSPKLARTGMPTR